ncbi:nitroreductase family protein, partial [Candidatus Latescibacterota bacterium]
NVLDAVKSRYSVRSYTSEPIGDSELSDILEAARFSQSAKNFQDWRLIVVRDREMKRKLVPACRNQHFIEEASVLIVCCGINIDYVMTCGQHTYNLDVAIAMENMALTAHDIGLGTCWLGAFYEDQVKELLGIPRDGVRIVGILAVGHPKERKTPVKNREPLETIVKYESW